MKLVDLLKEPARLSESCRYGAAGWLPRRERMITMESLDLGEKARYLKYLAEAGVGTMDHNLHPVKSVDCSF